MSVTRSSLELGLGHLENIQNNYILNLLMDHQDLPSSSFTSNTTHHSPVISASTSGFKKKRKAGRKKFRETRHPIYRGVRQRNGKWVCELRTPPIHEHEHEKSSFWVGTFTCPEMAARAYDVAALALKGQSTALNFPDLAYSLPRLTPSSSFSLIRSTAVEAAKNFSTVVNTSSSSYSSTTLFIDEDELFNMPEIISGMAEGLLLTPPGMKKGFNWEEEELENTMELPLSLWSDE